MARKCCTRHRAHRHLAFARVPFSRVPYRRTSATVDLVLPPGAARMALFAACSLRAAGDAPCAWCAGGGGADIRPTPRPRASPTWRRLFAALLIRPQHQVSTFSRREGATCRRLLFAAPRRFPTFVWTRTACLTRSTTFKFCSLPRPS